MNRVGDRADDGLDRFHPAVASWFREQFGEPTPPQRLGWPAIAAGQNTLIVAPTGSGKTLAAFLAALDHLWRHPATREGRPDPLRLAAQGAEPGRLAELAVSPRGHPGTRSRRDGDPLPPLSVGVRSGDTPSQERVRMVRKPPDILITTPESLHLMLTSRARETLRGISHVIVDEIHAVCGNKRGVFLALLLERLEAINLEPSGSSGSACRPPSARSRKWPAIWADSRRTRQRVVRAPARDDHRRGPAARPGPEVIWPASPDGCRRPARSGRRSRTSWRTRESAPFDDHLHQ